MSTPTLSREEIAAAVSGAVREILPVVTPEEIRGDRHLKDLGADSLERVEIIMQVLDRLGLSIPLAEFADLPDIDAMVDLLERSSR
jgi:polyketide biosynthesis acyl carrier protein